MSIRTITIPDAIQCVDLTTGKALKREITPPKIENGRLIEIGTFEDDTPWSLFRFLVIFVAQRPEWQKPLDRTLRLSDFLLQLNRAAPGQTISVSEELWRDLRDTLEAEDFGIPYPYNMQLPPLSRAILDAKAASPALAEVS